MAGAGIARIAEFHARADLEVGRLIELLADAGVVDEEDICALHRGIRQMPARIRAFLDFVVPPSRADQAARLAQVPRSEFTVPGIDLLGRTA